MSELNQKKVSCIVPIYNEANRVSSVLNAVVGHEMVGEVIVVNDGSSDNSKEVLEKWQGIRLISYEKNRGKSFAVMTGIKESQNDLVMLIDSDLIGLDRKSISDLIVPVTGGRADMSISLRKNSLLIFKMLGIDFVSGERVFSKELIGNPDQLGGLPGFGLEAFLNRIVIAERLKLKVVHWKNVISPRKSKKVGWWQGTKGDFLMILQIISTIKLSGLLYQMFKMRSLRTKN